MVMNKHFMSLQEKFVKQAKKQFLRDAAKVVRDLGRYYEYVVDDTDADGKVYKVHLHYNFNYIKLEEKK